MERPNDHNCATCGLQIIYQSPIFIVYQVKVATGEMDKEIEEKVGN